MTTRFPLRTGLGLGSSARLPIALAVLTTTVCLIGIGGRSLWLDEAITVATARTTSGQYQWLSLFENGGNMFSYYVFMRVWTFPGDAEWFVRLPSVLFAVGGVLVLFALSERLFGVRTAVIASLLLLINSSFVHYAQEARSYSLEILIVTASWFALIHAIERRSARAWATYVIVTVLSVYTLFFGILFVAAQLASLLALPRQQVPARQLGVSLGVISALLVPLAAAAVLFTAVSGGSTISFIPPLSVSSLNATASFFAAGGSSVLWTQLPLVVVYALLWLAGSAIALFAYRRRGKSTNTWYLVAVISWLLTPVVATILVSIAHPILVPRYLSASLPAAALLAAVVLARFSRLWITAALVTSLLGLAVPGVLTWYHQEDVAARSATRYVLAAARSDDGIVFFPFYERRTFDYYLERLGGRPPVPISPGVAWTNELQLLRYPKVSLHDQLVHAEAHRTVWVYLGQGQVQPLLHEFIVGLSSEYSLVRTRHFAGVQVFCFQRKATPAAVAAVPVRIARSAGLPLNEPAAASRNLADRRDPVDPE